MASRRDQFSAWLLSSLFSRCSLRCSVIQWPVYPRYRFPVHPEGGRPYTEISPCGSVREGGRRYRLVSVCGISRTDGAGRSAFCVLRSLSVKRASGKAWAHSSFAYRCVAVHVLPLRPDCVADFHAELRQHLLHILYPGADDIQVSAVRFRVLACASFLAFSRPATMTDAWMFPIRQSEGKRRQRWPELHAG